MVPYMVPGTRKVPAPKAPTSTISGVWWSILNRPFYIAYSKTKNWHWLSRVSWHDFENVLNIFVSSDSESIERAMVAMNINDWNNARLCFLYAVLNQSIVHDCIWRVGWSANKGNSIVPFRFNHKKSAIAV